VGVREGEQRRNSGNLDQTILHYVNGETELLSNQLAAGLLARSWAHTFPEQTRSERRLTWKGYHLTAGWLWVGAGVLVLAFGVGLLSRGARACGSLNFCGDTTERTRINWRPVSGGEVALLRLRHERDVSPAPLQTRPSPISKHMKCSFCGSRKINTKPQLYPGGVEAMRRGRT
jgi:hypothetical protein